MNLDDIIKLAKECGLLINSNDRSSTSSETSFLVEDCYFYIERFVELIRADEREQCLHAAEVAASLLNDPIAAIRARGSNT